MFPICLYVSPSLPSTLGPYTTHPILFLTRIKKKVINNHIFPWGGCLKEMKRGKRKFYLFMIVIFYVQNPKTFLITLYLLRLPLYYENKLFCIYLFIKDTQPTKKEKKYGDKIVYFIFCFHTIFTQNVINLHRLV